MKLITQQVCLSDTPPQVSRHTSLPCEQTDATTVVGIHPTGMHSSGFPLRLENLEKWEGIFQSGKSQEKSHKILENDKITDNYF